jgi:P-type Cu+ transporter
MQFPTGPSWPLPATLVKGDLRGIAQARLISDDPVANMNKTSGLHFSTTRRRALGRGRSVSITGWLLSLMIAALAMSLSSVSVITNALRLRAKHE